MHWRFDVNLRALYDSLRDLSSIRQEILTVWSQMKERDASGTWEAEYQAVLTQISILE